MKVLVTALAIATVTAGGAFGTCVMINGCPTEASCTAPSEVLTETVAQPAAKGPCCPSEKVQATIPVTATPTVQAKKVCTDPIDCPPTEDCQPEKSCPTEAVAKKKDCAEKKKAECGTAKKETACGEKKYQPSAFEQ